VNFEGGKAGPLGQWVALLPGHALCPLVLCCIAHSYLMQKFKAPWLPGCDVSTARAFFLGRSFVVATILGLSWLFWVCRRHSGFVAAPCTLSLHFSPARQCRIVLLLHLRSLLLVIASGRLARNPQKMYERECERECLCLLGSFHGLAPLCADRNLYLLHYITPLFQLFVSIKWRRRRV
jgi:hypothetical protein